MMVQVKVKEAKLEKVGSDLEDPWCPAKTPYRGQRAVMRWGERFDCSGAT